jgi:translocation and assembly module TamB
MGRLSSSGDLANRDGRRLRFSGQDVRLGELTPLSGAMDVDGKLVGDAWSGQAKSDEISWNNRSLGSLSLSARQEGEQLLVSGQLFAGAGLKMSVGMVEGLPYSADVSLAVKELALGSALGESLLVSASGKAVSQGRLSDWGASRGNVQLSSLSLSRKDFQVDSAGPFALSFDAGRLSMDAVTFKGPNTQLSMQGWLGPKALDVKVRGSADVRLLESFAPSLQRTAGRVDLSATATGPLPEISLFGSAALKDVRFLVRDHPLTVRQLSGDVEFSEARLLVRNGQGILNDGRFEIAGDLRLDRFEPQAVNLSAQFRDVAYRLSDELPLTASGQLALKGPVSSLELGGEVNVQKLRYEKPFSLDSLMRGGQVPRFSRAAEAPQKEWVKLDVGVTLGDVKVENNLAQAKLMGKLRLVGTNARMGVLGTLESGPGSQAFFRNNRFTIGHGLVQFTDRNSIQAGFDIQAETQVREYLVRLHAYGEVQKPKFTLTSQPELSENDILSLLTLGMTSKDKVSSAQASAGLAAEALFAASGLDRQFQRFLPKNPVLRDFSFNIGTSYNDATGVVEPAAQLESKFLTEQLRLQMARPVSGKGTRAKAEYRFDNGLSAQAQWDNEHTDASFGNLGMDLKLRWEVE